MEILSLLAILVPALCALVILADACAAPYGRAALLPRSMAGTGILLLTVLLVFALLLALTGAPLVAIVVVTALWAALSLISNIKRRVLGEPLVFSDFALIGALFQQPQFYLSALSAAQIAVLGGGFAILIAGLIGFSSVDLEPRMIGLVLAFVVGGILGITIRSERGISLAPVPDPEADVMRHGLVPSVIASWHDWLRTKDPEPCQAPSITGQSQQLVVVVQCESFTDPAEIFSDPTLTLPGLELARQQAWRSGRLMVPGFGAYTMRTEYGVLFGRGEEMLGSRRFDPFLTARGEVTWALPNRLDPDEWSCSFVHPHDMRFYGRDQLMPDAGFGALIGPDQFDPVAKESGLYVSDAAIADRIIELARDGSGAELVYAVTIENHGPWPAGQSNESSGAAAPYLNLLARSDAMLSRLLEALPKSGRSAILCFFGDHRPSIPGASEPGADRHTPFVLLRWDEKGKPIPGDGPEESLKPAELHHAILDAIRLGSAER